MEKLQVFYDGTCKTCTVSAAVASRLAPAIELKNLAEGHLPPEATLKDAMTEMYVLDSTGMAHKGYLGILKILEQSPWLFWCAPIGRLPLISMLGKLLYRLIARNRR